MGTVTKHLPQFRFFRAEEVFTALGDQSQLDLLSLEGDLGKFSDCIIIICESESAFAELGAFALNDELVKQLLIVNNQDFKSSTSFITGGPIARADKLSKFKPAVYTNFEAITLSIPDVVVRLSQIPHLRSYSMNIGGDGFLNITNKERLLLISDIVSLLGPLTKSELIEVIKASTGITKSIPLDTELALASSLDLISKTSRLQGPTFYFHSLKEKSHFIDYQGIERKILRSQIMRNYIKTDHNRIKALIEAI